MKKRNKKNLVRLMATLGIMSLFLFGCGKTGAATDTNNEKEDVVAEAPEVEEPAEETLANEIIMNSDPIADWVLTLEEEDLKFIIYNDVEGYKQILNDGETYHMKKDDKIFLYHPNGNINDETVLTPETPVRSGKDIFISRGFSLDIIWKEEDSVTYGREMFIDGFLEPMSITCTFYKAIE